MIKKFSVSLPITQAAIRVLREDSRVLRYENIDGVRTESLLGVASILEDFVGLAGKSGWIVVTYEAHE